MRISFVGAGAVTVKFAEHFYTYINNMKKEGIKPAVELGGFYNLPLGSLSRIVTKYNCPLYTSLDDLANNSDIIALLCPEAQIKQYVNQLRYLHTCGKIIFHISRMYDSDFIDNDYKNTFVSLYSSANLYITLPLELKTLPYIIEGRGEDLEKFKDLLVSTGLNVNCVSKENANVFLSALKQFEMNMFASVSALSAMAEASTGVDVKSMLTTIVHSITAMAKHSETYLNTNITPNLTALNIHNHLKGIKRLDMKDYTNFSRYAIDICTQKSDLSNEDKFEISLETKKLDKE